VIEQSRLRRPEYGLREQVEGLRPGVTSAAPGLVHGREPCDDEIRRLLRSRLVGGPAAGDLPAVELPQHPRPQTADGGGTDPAVLEDQEGLLAAMHGEQREDGSGKGLRIPGVFADE
jgi:hypothetical protein